MFDHIDTLFNEGTKLSMVVSIQTGSEPYLSTVKNNFELFLNENNSESSENEKEKFTKKEENKIEKQKKKKKIWN
mgnify:CR=1 FL=1